jgi:hypothetical protein
MYDAGKIISGLVFFFLLVTFPIWVSVGEDVGKPEPVIKTTEQRCVEPADYMKTNHMQLLIDWRNDVVRNNDREYVSQAYGTRFEKSLSSTGKQSCMSCHDSKAAFCDACHDYAGVVPNCWTCHIEPKENI